MGPPNEFGVWYAKPDQSGCREVGEKNVSTGFGISTDDLGRGFYAWEVAPRRRTREMYAS